MWEDNRGWTFSLEEVLFWIVDSHFVLMMDLFLTNTLFVKLLASKDINWWTGVVWITCRLMSFVFLSAVWTHSDGTHSLQRIHWNAKLHIWWRNKLIYILDGLRVSKRSSNFHFFWGELFLKKVNRVNSVSMTAMKWKQQLHIFSICSCDTQKHLSE